MDGWMFTNYHRYSWKVACDQGLSGFINITQDPCSLFQSPASRHNSFAIDNSLSILRRRWGSYMFSYFVPRVNSSLHLYSKSWKETLFNNVCYGLNVVSSQNSYIETLISSEMVVGGGAFWRWLGLYKVVKWGSCNEINVLTRWGKS